MSESVFLATAGAVLRGLAEFMAGDDHGIVEVTNEWDDARVLLRLTPGRSAFLGPGDAAARAEAGGWQIDIRAAAGDDFDEDAEDVIDRLISG